MGQQSVTIGLDDRLPRIFLRRWDPDPLPPGPPRVILALHDALGSSADYGQFAEAATSAGFSVAAFDFFGHGGTGWAENLDPRSFLLVQADLIARMLQGIRSRGAIPFLLASSGSANAAVVALLRLLGKLEGMDRLPVVLAEPGFVMDSSTCDYLRSCMPFLRQRYAGFEQALEAWNGTELGNIHFPDPATRDRYVRSRLLEERGNGFRPSLSDERIRFLEERTMRPVNRVLKLPEGVMLTNPILFMLGDGFPRSSGHREKLFGLFEGKASALDVHWVEHGYHPLSLAYAGEVDPVLDFFRTHAPC